LQALRADSSSSIEQLRQNHQTAVEDLKSQHASALGDLEQSLQKQLSSKTVELRATGDDLAKAKAALAAALQDVEALKAQLGNVQKDAAAASASAPADQSAEVEKLRKNLADLRDDHTGLMEVFNATKESISEMKRTHNEELEAAATSRADEATGLKAAHEAEVQRLVQEKVGLLSQLSDMEGELATARAGTGAESVASAPRRSNGAAHAGAGVSSEDLQKMHEAHTLKMNDLAAAHERTLQAMQDELEAANARAKEFEQDVERHKLEIVYLEQDQDEKDDQITRYVRRRLHSRLLRPLVGLARLFCMF
jgi:hypothetical protein